MAFFPTRARGQNFLHDRSVATRFAAEALRPPGAASSGAASGRAIVEIGPGKGAITFPLLEAGARVLAIELDPRLADVIESRARDRGLEQGLHLVRGNALRLDFGAVLEAFGAAPPLPLCGNLPFSTASVLLLRLIEGGEEAPLRFHPLTLTLQREVAERAAARPGTPEYGALSVVVQQAMRVRIRFLIHPAAFRPRPRVVSAVVRLRPRPDPPPVGDPGHFRTLVRGLFTHRRKTLKNAAAALPPPPAGDPSDGPPLPERIRRALDELDIAPGLRPEALTPAQFAALARKTASAD